MPQVQGFLGFGLDLELAEDLDGFQGEGFEVLVAPMQAVSPPVGGGLYSFRNEVSTYTVWRGLHPARDEVSTYTVWRGLHPVWDDISTDPADPGREAVPETTEPVEIGDGVPGGLRHSAGRQE